MIFAGNQDEILISCVNIQKEHKVRYSTVRESEA